MGFITHLRSLLKRDYASAGQPLRSGSGIPDFLFSGSTQAMAVATVYRCVQFLAESVASLPMRHMRLRGDIFVPDIKSRLNLLLTLEPNPLTSAFEFWTQMMRNLLLDGNAYIVPKYDPIDMQLMELVLCDRGTVSHDTTNDIYTIRDSRNAVSGKYDEADIIHIKGCPGYDSKTGLSVISFARETINSAFAADKESYKRFATGGTVRGIISDSKLVRGVGKYQDKEMKRASIDIAERFNNGENIVSVPYDVEFKQLAMSSADMQFIQSRQFTVRDICRFFGVHPSFVFDDTSNNYKSAEMANVAFLSNTLNPLLRKIEHEFTRKLIGVGLSPYQRLTFDRRELYACDLESRAKYQAQTLGAGLYTVNEWRKIENMPRVEGGDRVLVSANLRDITESSTNQAKTNE